MLDIQRLKEAKKAKKITFDNLSVESGIPVSTIYDIFRGVTTSPRIDTIEAIEKALGLDDDQEAQEFTLTAKETVTGIEYDLLTAFRKLTDNEKKALLQTAELWGDKK